MKRKRYTEDQIIQVLKEAENGIAASELCRKYGVSDATIYNWKSKYGGMGASDLRRLKTLEEENRKLKTIVAEQALDIQCLKGVLAKNS